MQHTHSPWRIWFAVPPPLHTHIVTISWRASAHNRCACPFAATQTHFHCGTDENKHILRLHECRHTEMRKRTHACMQDECKHELTCASTQPCENPVVHAMYGERDAHIYRHTHTSYTNTHYILEQMVVIFCFLLLSLLCVWCRRVLHFLSYKNMHTCIHIYIYIYIYMYINIYV